MSKGKKMVESHTYFGSPEWLKIVQDNRKHGMNPPGAVVLDGVKLGHAIDAAISFEQREILKQCLAIAEQEGAISTAYRIRALLYAAEWPDKAKKKVEAAKKAEAERRPVTFHIRLTGYNGKGHEAHALVARFGSVSHSEASSLLNAVHSGMGVDTVGAYVTLNVADPLGFAREMNAIGYVTIITNDGQTTSIGDLIPSADTVEDDIFAVRAPS